MIHIYTGDGKGKTTAAAGLAFRAAGAGLRVCVIQFLKGRAQYNEIEMFRKLSKKCRIIKFDQVHPMFSSRSRTKSIAEAKIRIQAQDDFETAREIVLSKKYDVVIMDEIINLVSQDFLPKRELTELMDATPRKVELVLTGRGASKALLERADYATEMRLVKHPYYKGKKARKGIEY